MIAKKARLPSLAASDLDAGLATQRHIDPALPLSFHITN
jgi:hypothetical protein